VGALHLADIAQQLESSGNDTDLSWTAGLVDQLEDEFERVLSEIAELKIQQGASPPGKTPL
jgi:hypothetical protein